ncbi:MAG: NADH-quinone oxidoreductase subunit NuoK [Candidatus Porifericomitaceae bacterium WSBS_2022_MAG_OTU9]
MSALTLNHYLVLAAILFCISVTGIFINRKNMITLLMCIELMLLSVNMNFIAFSYFMGDPHGHLFVLFTLTVAAAETAIGLSILTALYRERGTINIEKLNQMSG